MNSNHSFKKYINLKFLVTTFVLVTIGLVVNIIIRYNNFFSIFSIRNQYPFGLRIDIIYIAILVITATLFLFFLKITKKHPIACSLILVGAWSNLLERLIFGYVVDYINVNWGYINIADIILWSGLLLINYQVWFIDPMEEKYSKETHNSIIAKMEKPRKLTEEKIEKDEVVEKLVQEDKKTDNKLVFKKGNKTSFSKLDIPKPVKSKEVVAEEAKMVEPIKPTKPKKQVISLK